MTDVSFVTVHTVAEKVYFSGKISGLSYFSKAMPKSRSKLVCLQSRPITYWKCLAQYKTSKTTAQASHSAVRLPK